MVSRRNDEWLTRERLLVLVLAGATVLVAWLCWQLVKPFVPSITWALVLAVLAHPMHERIAAKLKRPSVSAALAVVLVTIAIALPATLVVRQIGVEAVESASTARKLVDADRWKLAIERFPRLAPLREWVEREVDVEEKVEEASTEVAKGVRGLLQRAVDLAIAVLITLFLLFYFLRDKHRILRVIASSSRSRRAKPSTCATTSATRSRPSCSARSPSPSCKARSAASCSGGSACPRRSCGARSWRCSRSCRCSAPR